MVTSVLKRYMQYTTAYVKFGKSLMIMDILFSNISTRPVFVTSVNTYLILLIYNTTKEAIISIKMA